jgi:hypothetical protein
MEFRMYFVKYFLGHKQHYAQTQASPDHEGCEYAESESDVSKRAENLDRKIVCGTKCRDSALPSAS